MVMMIVIGKGEQVAGFSRAVIKCRYCMIS
jgi:hypothetical protein